MMNKTSLTAVVLGAVFSPAALAVTSVITRYQSGADFQKGKTDKVTVTSEGTLRLSFENSDVDCGGLLKDVWAIHTLYTDPDGAVYLGTGPDAKVIRIAGQKAEQVYPSLAASDGSVGDILNEHVFAITQDVSGRLLIGVSGAKGKLVRLGKDSQTVFEDERVQYIFAMVRDSQNNIYLGTGPQGLIFKLDPFGDSPQVLYDAKDKSILSLAVQDSVLYAGSDERGVIYRIDLSSRAVSVLFDSDQDEVPALLVGSEGDLFAVTSSAQAAMLQMKIPDVSLTKLPGRPDVPGKKEHRPEPVPEAESLNTANSEEPAKEDEEKPRPKAPAPPAAKVAGHIYRISPEGFVEDLFSEMAVFYSLLEDDGLLWAGTGNKGRLYTVDPKTEEKAIVFEDETSSQITCMIPRDGGLYAGLSNPARLVRLEKRYVTEGIYTSDLVDASQPARWGKLQIEADLPDRTGVFMACRSGNINEPNDGSFSEWTPDVAVDQPVDLTCPVGRFCQYRLTLRTGAAAVSPTVRQVTLAHAIGNLAPRVVAVQTGRSRDKSKPFVTEIAFRAEDDNKDTLEYTLAFRKEGRSVWIPLKDELDKPVFEWDGRTVEDGRYEVRVTANDRKSNTPDTALTGSRISDIFVMDSTAPEITDARLTVQDGAVLAVLTVKDALSVFGTVRYTVDSNEKWNTVQPDDGVYDTLAETFTIRIGDLKTGDHVIAFSAADDLDNTMYKTYEVTIP